MSSLLVRIKRAMLSGRYVLTGKARREMDADGLTDLDVVEAIVSANAIYKTVRSRSPRRGRRRERLYIILGENLLGMPIYTKGKLVRTGASDVYYLLVSSKRSV